MYIFWGVSGSGPVVVKDIIYRVYRSNLTFAALGSRWVSSVGVQHEDYLNILTVRGHLDHLMGVVVERGRDRTPGVVRCAA